MEAAAQQRQMSVEEIVEEERKLGAIVFVPSSLNVINYYVPVIERIELGSHELYKAQGKWRIHYNGLHRLANAAGIEWIAAETRRTDNRSDKLYVSFQAVGGVRYNDGKIYFVKGEYDLDLEVAEEELKDQYLNKGKEKNLTGEALENFINKGVRSELIQKRKRKLTLAESGAKARVIRAILGIKANYDQKEIMGVPFVIVRFVLDHQHPDVKQLFLAAAQQSMAGIFGGGTAPQLVDNTITMGDVIDLPPEEEPEPENPSGNAHPLDGCSIQEQRAMVEQAAQAAGVLIDIIEQEEAVGLAEMDSEMLKSVYDKLKR